VNGVSLRKPWPCETYNFEIRGFLVSIILNPPPCTHYILAAAVTLAARAKAAGWKPGK